MNNNELWCKHKHELALKILHSIDEKEKEYAAYALARMEYTEYEVMKEVMKDYGKNT